MTGRTTRSTGSTKRNNNVSRKEDDTPAKENNTDGESSSDGDNYWVEKILRKRKTKKGKFEYLVKWKKFTEEDNSWVPEENCEGCQEAIKEYEELQKKKKRR